MKILFVSPGDDKPDYQDRYEIICQTICQDCRHTARVVIIDPTGTTQDLNDLYNCEEKVVILHSSIINSSYKMIQKMKVSGKTVIADLCQPVWFEEMQSPDWAGLDRKRIHS